MDSEYDQKFEEMKKYIPFLENMIKRLESSELPSNPRQAQLDKIRSLRDLLLDKKKRMKMENLLKCEQVLINLYAKVEQRNLHQPVDAEKTSTEKDKTDLNTARNKLKSMAKPKLSAHETTETLPEIERASKTEEICVQGSKEPALFQRRPNKASNSVNTSSVSSAHETEVTPSKRNYTRVLQSPEAENTRWRSSSEKSEKQLFSRRSPHRCTESSSRKERKKSKQKGKYAATGGLNVTNITLQVPEESLSSLNTDDILSRIINCSDGDVDINTLRELRTQILGELKKTGSKDDISDLILKSYKKKDKRKKMLEMEDGELSDSESETIKNVYSSIVVLDKDKKVKKSVNESADSEAPRIQICLVFNNKEQDTPKVSLENKIDPTDFENYNNDVLVKTLSKGEVLKTSETIEIKDTESKADDSLLPEFTKKETCKNVLTGTDTSIEKCKDIISNLPKVIEEKRSKDGVFDLLVKCNEDNNHSNVVESTSSMPVESSLVIEELEEKKYNDQPTIRDENVEIPLLDIEETSKKEVASEIDILQALKKEILSETSTALHTNVDTPALHQPKISKVQNSSEIGSKKRISIENYKAKVTNPVENKNVLKITMDAENDIIKKQSLKLTEKECERFNFLSKIALHDSSDDEDQSGFSMDEIYSDLAPKSPDHEDFADTGLKPPIIIPNDPISKITTMTDLDVDMRKLSSAEPNSMVNNAVVSSSTPGISDGSEHSKIGKDFYVESNIEKKIPLQDPRIKRDANLKIDIPESTVNSENIAGSIVNFGNLNPPQNNSTNNASSNLAHFVAPKVTAPLIPNISPVPVPFPNMSPAPLVPPLLLPALVNNLIGNMTPIMTPNARTFEMTPSRLSMDSDDSKKDKHVYAPMFTNYDTHESDNTSERQRQEWNKRENRLPVWERERNSGSRIPVWEDSESRNNMTRDKSYQGKNDTYRQNYNENNYRYDNRESYNRLECPRTPIHSFGRLECPSTPTPSFGRSDIPTTPVQSFGRSDYMQRPSNNKFDPRRSRAYDYHNRDDEKERRYFNDRSFHSHSYRPNHLNNHTRSNYDSSRQYDRETSVGRHERNEGNRRSYYRETSVGNSFENDYDDNNYSNRRNSYTRDDYYNQSKNNRDYHQRGYRDYSTETAKSVKTYEYDNSKNNLATVCSKTGKDYTIDTSVSKTFQINSNDNFDSRRRRAASVGRTMDCDNVDTKLKPLKDKNSGVNKERFCRAASVGREVTKALEDFNDIKEDLKSFQLKSYTNIMKNNFKSDDISHKSIKTECSQSNKKKNDDQLKVMASSNRLTPKKKSRDPRIWHDNRSGSKSKYDDKKGLKHQKNHGIVYSNDNISKGTILGSGYGVKNYKIPKIKRQSTEIEVPEKADIKTDTAKKDVRSDTKSFKGSNNLDENINFKHTLSKIEGTDIALHADSDEVTNVEPKAKSVNDDETNNIALKVNNKMPAKVNDLVLSVQTCVTDEKNKKINDDELCKPSEDVIEKRVTRSSRKKIIPENNILKESPTLRKSRKLSRIYYSDSDSDEDSLSSPVNRKRESVLKNDIKTKNVATPEVSNKCNESVKSTKDNPEREKGTKTTSSISTEIPKKAFDCLVDNKDIESTKEINDIEERKRITSSVSTENPNRDCLTDDKDKNTKDNTETEESIKTTSKEIPKKVVERLVDDLETFEENLVSDPVIDNINSLIADLDQDLSVDDAKDTSIESKKCEYIDNKGESVQTSSGPKQKQTDVESYDPQVSSEIPYMRTASKSVSLIQENLKQSTNVHQQCESKQEKTLETTNLTDESNQNSFKITQSVPSSHDSKNTNSEPVVSTTEKIDNEEGNVKYVDSTVKQSMCGDDANNLENLPDSTGVSENVINYSTEDSTNFMADAEDLRKPVNQNEISLEQKLLLLLQDKTKMKELISKLSSDTCENDKIKKKLEKLSEIVSDDEENNQNEEKIKDKSNDRALDVTLENETDVSISNNLSVALDNSTKLHQVTHIEYRYKNDQYDSIIEKETANENLSTGTKELKNDTSKCGDNTPLNVDGSDEIKQGQQRQNNVCEQEAHVTFDKEKKEIDSAENKLGCENNVSMELSSKVDDMKEALQSENNTCLKDNKKVFIKGKPKGKRNKRTSKFNKNAKPIKSDICVNKGQPKVKKPSRELQRLQDDLREVYMKEDILASTGIRMCRLAKLAKDQQKEELNVSENESIVEDKKSDAIETNKTEEKKMLTTLVSSNDLESKSDKKPLIRKPGPKSKTKPKIAEENNDPYEFETDSINESIVSESKNESSSDSETDHNATTAEKEITEKNKRIKRKRGNRGWQAGIIKPKNKKKNDIKPDNILKNPDYNCFTDKSYCFKPNTLEYSCRLCAYTGSDIIPHYMKNHPHSEIPLSRLCPDSATEAMKQCEEVNIRAISKMPSTKYTCRFCFKDIVKKKFILEEFFWHVVSTHTGEYKQQCPECKDASKCPFVNDIPPPPENDKGQLLGYICSKCNFTQVSMENLKTHVIVRHNNEETHVYTINLSVISKKAIHIYLKNIEDQKNILAIEKPRPLRSTRSKQSLAESSDEENGVSATETNTPEQITNIQSKLTFESDNLTETPDNKGLIKVEPIQEVTHNDDSVADDSINELETVEQLNNKPSEETEIGINPQDGVNSATSNDIFTYPHFKVTTTNGSKEYVCCINGNDFHYKTSLLISMKKHVQIKHRENWDGYCSICKVIVTPQGKHNFKECLNHYLDKHIDDFPIVNSQGENEMEKNETQQDERATEGRPDNNGSRKSYSNVIPLEQLITTTNEPDNTDESSSGLPVIESVVSLNTSDQPLPSPNYPKCSSTDPVVEYKYEEAQADIMSKKHRVVLDAMMSNTHLVQIFKCAGKFCSFTTDNAEEALLHASTHVRIGGEYALCCVYCDYDATGNAIDLVTHVFKKHGCCPFVCGFCFYRAAASQLVQAHINRVHPNSNAQVLRTTVVTGNTDDDDSLPRNTAVPFYRCCGDQDTTNPCKFRTYTPGKFCEHIQTRHLNAAQHKCFICSEASSSATELVRHMKIHGLKLYQCTRCVYGADNEPELLGHASAKHPYKQPTAYLRIITNKEGSAEFKVLPLAHLNNSKVTVTEVIPNVTAKNPVREAERARELETLIGESTSMIESISTSVEVSVAAVPTLLETIPPPLVARNASYPVLPMHFTKCSPSPTTQPAERSNSPAARKLPAADTAGEVPASMDRATVTPVASVESDTSYIPNVPAETQHLIRPKIEPLEDLATADDTHVPELQDVKPNFAQNRTSGIVADAPATIVANAPATIVADAPATIVADAPATIVADAPATIVANAPDTIVADAPATVTPVSASTVKKNINIDHVVYCLDSDDEVSTENVIDLSDEVPSAPEEKDNPIKKVCLWELFKCGKCTSVMKSGHGLKKHLRSCYGGDPDTVTCGHCNMDIKKGLITAHLTSSHLQQNSLSKYAYVCPVCFAELKSVSVAQNHFKALHFDTHHKRVMWKIQEVGNHTESLSRAERIVKVDQESRPQRKRSVGSRDKTAEPPEKIKKFGPQDVDRLPINPILDELVYCALCEFNTKVRLNMVRHLQLHAQRQPVADASPVNPVPHLETNEMHFDKMLNLASSSRAPDRPARADPAPPVAPALARIPRDLAGRYPKYVPDRQRHTCGARACSYISVDESMLKCHWDTLHAGTAEYRCVHCPPTQHLNGQITAARICNHLKMHDVSLYACSLCSYYHYKIPIVEKHLNDVHGRGEVLIVRDERDESSAPALAPAAAAAFAAGAPTMDLKPWQCGLCQFRSLLRPEVVEHCAKVHNSKMQYKCGYCAFRASNLENVSKHQSKSHSGTPEDVFYYYYRDGSVPDEADGTPRWAKQKQKMGSGSKVKSEAADGAPAPPAQAAVLPAIVQKVDLNLVKEEVTDVDEAADLCLEFGEFCEPNGLKYKCPLCQSVTEDTEESMQSHLYEELKYRMWGCPVCSYKAFHRAGFREHAQTEHKQFPTLEPHQLPADPRADQWIAKLLEHQKTFIARNREKLAIQKAEIKRTNPSAVSQKLQNVAQPSSSPKPPSRASEEVEALFGTYGKPSGALYCCPKCSATFKEENEMREHLESELSKIRWYCSGCSRTFTTYHEAQFHCSARCEVTQAGAHSRPTEAPRDASIRADWVESAVRSQTAAIDRETSTSSGALRETLPEQDDNSLLVVRYERQVSAPEERITSVELPESSEPPLAEPPRRETAVHRCPHCSYITPHAKLLTGHVLKHYDLKPCSCPYCGLDGHRKQVIKHQRTGHPQEPVNVVDTEIPTETPQEYLRRKSEPGTMLICLVCRKPFPEAAAATHRHDNFKPDFGKEGEFVVMCCVCSMLHKEVTGCLNHHRACHPQDKVDYEICKLSAGPGLSCGECGAKFAAADELKAHMSQRHPKKGAAHVGAKRKSLDDAILSARKVAKKSTSGQPRPFARKSTTKLPLANTEEYSYYGTTRPSENLDESIKIPFCNTMMPFTVKKVPEIFGNPVVPVKKLSE